MPHSSAGPSRFFSKGSARARSDNNGDESLPNVSTCLGCNEPFVSPKDREETCQTCHAQPFHGINGGPKTKRWPHGITCIWSHKNTCDKKPAGTGDLEDSEKSMLIDHPELAFFITCVLDTITDSGLSDAGDDADDNFF